MYICVSAGEVMKFYNIADMLLSVSGYMDETTVSRMSGYETELSGRAPDVEIDIELRDKPIEIPKDNCLIVSTNEMWHLSDSVLSYYLCFPDLDGAAVCVDCNPDFSKIHICLYDVKAQLGYNDTCYLFNTMSNILHYIALNHGRLVFHSSSVCAEGMGVAFSASSGVGKSTHTGLWLENIPGCSYINDDTPIISISEGRVMISGSPFAGTSGINSNVTVPLKAIVFVTRGEENKVVPVDTVTAFVRIMSQLKKPVNDIMSDKLISTLNLILKSVPCYFMECNISPEAALTAYKAIF